MLPLLLAVQLAATHADTDSVYATPALRTLIEGAAVANRHAPDSLRGYTSRIETEASLLIRDTLGRENSAEIEQLETAARWQRSGIYDLHVIGYRSQSVGVPYSTLSIVRAWTVPTLYGERLTLGAYFARASRGGSPDGIIAVHPFASDRESYYRFTGGDTVTVLQAGARRIPIVRVHVTPVTTSGRRFSAFDGEIDLDADRKQIVRLRGQFVTVNANPSIGERIAENALGVTAAAYVEFVNVEVAGKYWLPAFQRTEFQAQFGLFGKSRPVFRLVSTIRNIAVDDTGSVVTADSTDRLSVRVSWAPPDSVDAFHDWSTALGSQTTTVSSGDFDDVAPDRWKTTGPPRVDLFPSTLGRIARFNRVEGLYLGIAPSVDFRSLAPGLTISGYGGWAFTEKTARGGASIDYRKGLNSYGVRGERALATTNDFTIPLSEDPGIGALLGSIDNYDYVDRVTAAGSFTRILGSINTGLLTFQLGGGRDHSEERRLSKGLFGSKGFLPNRGVDDGSYFLTSADLEFHPNVSGDFVTPGVGAKVHAEAGNGDLDWQRTEISLATRKYFGPVSLAFHADGGAVFGSNPPPQQLFELGGNELLPGYSYKQFVGDRAALFRTYASYRFNVLKRPIAIGHYYIPGVNPGLAASIQGGWTELSSGGARLSAQRLGVNDDGTFVSTPTNGIRATAGGGITLFSDLLHVGLARPVDHSTGWRFVIGVGGLF